jgi:phosphoserine phosphatase
MSPTAMLLVATLISAPKDRALTPALADMASQAVGARSIDWLAEGLACDLVLPEGSAAGKSEASLREVLAGQPIDVAIQESAGRRKRLLIADMDSTMIDQECIDELADEVGLREHVAEITRRSMNGEIPFDAALRERVALLKGLETTVVDRIVENRLTLASGGRTLIATMRASGAWTALVSGGFDLFTSRIGQKLGFDEHRANVLVEGEGRLLGLVVEPILGREAKADALRDISARLGLTPRDAIAVGDGANDLDMIKLAGTGVALHAKPVVAAEARIRIDHGDLTAVLYLQGYRQADFVT